MENMRSLTNLIERNRAWAERIKAHTPDFFQKLSEQQSPEYLWIGCSDNFWKKSGVRALIFSAQARLRSIRLVRLRMFFGVSLVGWV